MSVFYNEQQERPRALWRLLLFGLMLSLTVGAFSAVASIISRLIVPGEVRTGAPADGAFIPPEVLLPGTLAALVGVFVAVWIACRWLDHRPVADPGLRLTREWWADLGFGLVLGAVAVGAVFAFELAAGWVQITGFGPTEAGAAFWTEFAMVLVAFIAVGIYEEIVARGYVMTNIAESFNTPGLRATGGVYAGWLLSSLVFALPHAFNPGASLAGLASIFASGMLLLGLAYLLTGRLGLCIGLHISWNFAQGALFGLPTSGGTVTRYPLVIAEQTGPELWTGGSFGLEGGVLGMVAILLACAALLIWVRRREGEITLREQIARPPAVSR